MNKLLLTFSIALCAFAAGTIGAVFMANFIATEVSEELALDRFDPLLLPEVEISESLLHIETVERGDLEWVESYHCWRLGTYLQQLERMEYDGDQNAEFVSRMEEAIETYRRLQTESRCGSLHRNADTSVAAPAS